MSTAARPPKVRAMLETKSVNWDVINSDAQAAFPLCAETL
ncbi:hypothetical protein GGD63_007967 [Bradyrhizobium sp. cir1]|nr:hypothetical protein [Bradyrhizobium sp. cir1]